MAERVTVDHAALQKAATDADGMAGAVERRRSALLDPLMAAEGHLAGASSSRHLAALSDAVLDVHGDLVTALGGLAQGLESVSRTFTEVDAVSAAEARSWWRGR